MERFSVSGLPDAELDNIAEHLAACQTCHQLFVETLRSQKGSSGLAFTLAPEYWLRHEHVEYDQLIAIADNKLDKTEREIIDIHLTTCAECREDVRNFLESAKQIEPELRVRYGQAVGRSRRQMIFWPNWQRGLTWNPIYAAAAAVIIVLALVIGVALLLKRRADNLEAKKTPPPQGIVGPTTQTPTPQNQAVAVQPTPAPVPSEPSPQRALSPTLVIRNRETIRSPRNGGSIAVVNDGPGTVTIDQTGNVSGLDQISPDARREIAEAVTTQSIKTPETVTELAGAPITLRGPDEGPKFKLRSPARTVILSDHPSFQWDALPGAASYQVSVGDLYGHEVLRSEQLPSDRTAWTPASPLKRGEIYAWEIEAIVDGKKVVSPGMSETQMKFKILSDKSARELEQLKKANSHLALGVFYAREGMLAEAEGEFQILIRKNSDSQVLKELLVKIQSWRQK